MTAFYNECDPYAAAWLRNLIAAGLIAPGIVDERKIQDIEAWELAGFTQCHFFAGIGIWSGALRAAGWPDDVPIWTGSCPCQPFSAAGKQKGFTDGRHLWPTWFGLIEQCKPSIVVGEQVASKDGLGWFDLVSTDMERAGYAIGASDLCAAGFGQAHLRQRLYFVGLGISDGTGLFEGIERPATPGQWNSSIATSSIDGLADALHSGRPERWTGTGDRPLAGVCDYGGMADADEQQRNRSGNIGARGRLEPTIGSGDSSKPVLHSRKAGSLDNADWLLCRNPTGEPNWRPVESKPQPMVDGSAERLGKLCSGLIGDLEQEIAAWEIRCKADARETLLDLQQAYAEKSKRKWAAGKLPKLYEAPFLLAFLRQLSQQGWAFSERLSCESKEVYQIRMRMLRDEATTTGSSCGRGLDEQRTYEPTNPVRLLSSILARYTQTAWGRSYETYASTGFPLRHGMRGRMGKLRAYGNALDFATAQGFCEAVGEIAGIRPVTEFGL